MKTLLQISLVVVLVCMLGSCESSGYSTTYVGTSYYRSPGWYDPYYSSRCCYTVVRPPVYRPGRPPGYHPGNRPGRPVQLPSRPRPPGGGGGRPRPMPR